MDYEAALSVAQAWIRALVPELTVDEARTVTRPYGWVFCFQPAGTRTGGPSGLIIDRVNGNVHALGTGSGP